MQGVTVGRGGGDRIQPWGSEYTVPRPTRKGTTAMKIALLALGVLAALVLVAGFGLRIRPAPFAPYSQPGGSIPRVPLPAGLPAPVERYYRTLYGDSVPLITSAVITGRGTMRPAGPVDIPVRFRFTHQAGQSYRHYFEATFFGASFLRVNEHFLDGHGRLEFPEFMGGVTAGANVDQGANLALWAEASWFPALWATDERVRWEAVDDQTALLSVPFGNTRETFVVRFDPETGLMTLMESMRFRGVTDTKKILWLNEVVAWAAVDGQRMGVTGAVTWFDQRTPWTTLTVESVVFNSDVADYVRQTGP